jgi:hypothetical protein
MRLPLTVLVTTFALVALAHQKSDSTDSHGSLQQQAHNEYERHKQAAIHINDLAGRTHSEADADVFVSEIRVLVGCRDTATSQIRKRMRLKS